MSRKMNIRSCTVKVMGQVSQVHGFEGGELGRSALISGGRISLDVPPMGFKTSPMSLHSMELAASDRVTSGKVQ